MLLLFDKLFWSSQRSTLIFFSYWFVGNHVPYTMIKVDQKWHWLNFTIEIISKICWLLFIFTSILSFLCKIFAKLKDKLSPTLEVACFAIIFFLQVTITKIEIWFQEGFPPPPVETFDLMSIFILFH